MRSTHATQPKPSSPGLVSRTRARLWLSLLMLICVAVAGYLVSDLIDSGKASASRASSNPAAAIVQSQRLIDGRLAVHAAGRGNPWLNLQDGRELTTVYKGSNEARALIESSAQPRTLATADFDEDG